MSEYQKLKARAQELQAQREAAVKRELEDKKNRDLAASKDEETRRNRLDAAAAEARRRELMAANAALTTVKTNGSAASIEYDPFAEDQPGQSSSAGPSKTRSKLVTGGRSGGGGSGTMRGAAASGSSVKREPRLPTNGSPAGTKRKEREITPPLLGRKERAARAFAEQIKKQAKADSLFSVRSLVETDDRGSESPRPKSINKPSQPRTNPLNGARSISKTLSAGKKGGMAMDEMRKLAPNRANWDRRTIDEIQRDLRAAKGKGGAAAMARTQSADNSLDRNGMPGNGTSKRPRSDSPVKAAQATPVAVGRTKPKPPPIPSSARRPSFSGPTGTKRPRSPSTSSSASSSSSTYARDARQRNGGNNARRRNSGGSLHEEDVSATIQAMFRRPGRAPLPARGGGYDSDASSDMEAGMSDVEEEERRAARIARREDEIAEREERERKAKKEREKRERLKGRA